MGATRRPPPTCWAQQVGAMPTHPNGRPQVSKTSVDAMTQQTPGLAEHTHAAQHWRALLQNVPICSTRLSQTVLHVFAHLVTKMIVFAAQGYGEFVGAVLIRFAWQISRAISNLHSKFAIASGISTIGYGLVVCGHWLAAIGYPLLLIDYWLSSSGSWLCVNDYWLWTIGYRPLVIDHWLSTIGSRLLVTGDWLATVG